MFVDLHINFKDAMKTTTGTRHMVVDDVDLVGWQILNLGVGGVIKS